MSNVIEYQGPEELVGRTQTALDEKAWSAWMRKNLLQERQGVAARAKGVKWACLGVLLIAAALSLYVFPRYVSGYEAVVRFAIGFGAILIIFQSLRTRQYAFTAVFAAIVLIFNPVFPKFALSGNWDRLPEMRLEFGLLMGPSSRAGKDG
jgi:hypothetical protein